MRYTYRRSNLRSNSTLLAHKPIAPTWSEGGEHAEPSRYRGVRREGVYLKHERYDVPLMRIAGTARWVTVENPMDMDAVKRSQQAAKRKQQRAAQRKAVKQQAQAAERQAQAAERQAQAAERQARRTAIKQRRKGWRRIVTVELPPLSCISCGSGLAPRAVEAMCSACRILGEECTDV